MNNFLMIPAIVSLWHRLLRRNPFIVHNNRHLLLGICLGIVGFVVAPSTAVLAQPAYPLSLQQAIQLAMRNNAQIKAKQLAEKWSQIMQSTAVDFGKTQFGADLGQVNTASFDTKFSIAQNFSLPTLYKKQQAVAGTVLLQSQTQTQLQMADIVKLVKQVYLQLQYLAKQKALLQRVDSMYQQFATIAQLRYEKGESSLLEKTTLNNQVQQVHLQKQMLQADESVAILQLQVLLQTAQAFQITDSLNVRPLLIDTTLLKTHPYWQWQQQQHQLAVQQTALEKAKLLPDVSLGYTNQSFVGWQVNKNRTEQYVNGTTRFSAAQLGVAFPLFAKAQKARIQAAKANEAIVQANVQIAQTDMQLQVQKWGVQQLQYWQALQYYISNALPQSNVMIAHANAHYQTGQISYLEWTTLMTNAFSIHSQYVQTLWQFNQSQIELDYLLHPLHH